MKNFLMTIKLCAFFIMIYSSACLAKGFISYENKNYNYKIIIPKKWKNKAQTKKAKHTLQIKKDHNTSIEVEAYSTTDDIDNIIRQKKWDLRNVKSRFRKIIETEKISINNNAVGKLLVFEYIYNRSNFLHRTLITKNNDIIYIINCKSPTWCFYRVEDIFTTAFASFGYLSSDFSFDDSSLTESEKPVAKNETSKSIDDDGLDGLEDIDGLEDESSDELEEIELSDKEMEELNLD